MRNLKKISKDYDIRKGIPLSFSDSIKIGVIAGTTFVIFAAGSFFLYSALDIRKGRKEYEDKKLYNLVKNTADIDKDDYTSNDEWAQVYNELGIQLSFDPIEQQKFKITHKQMKDYLDKHGVKY